MPAIRYWKPGRAYTTAIPGRSWWKPDGDRAVVAVAGFWDGDGELILRRAWFPLPPGDFIAPPDANTWGNRVVYMLNDKPQRVRYWADVSCTSPGGVVLEDMPASSVPGVRLTDLGLIWYQTATDRRAWRQWQAAQRRHGLQHAAVRRRTRNGRRRLDERDEQWRGFNRYWEGWRRERHVISEARGA